MRINFLVSNLAHTGGHRITFEYANRLLARGHDVAVYVPCVYPDDGQGGALGLFRRAKASVGNTLVHGRKPTWMDLRPPVHKPLTLARGVRDADATVASAWLTAESLVELPARCGAKVYHVQDYEVFWGERERVEETYRQGFFLIATSGYLVRTLRDVCGQEASLCTLALDLDRFTPKARGPVPKLGQPLRVLTLHHLQARKGTDRALAALARARSLGAQLQVTVFGTHVPPRIAGADFVVRAPRGEKLAMLYAVHDVYLALPPTEGWGLTVTEAMASGSCVVSTAVGALEHVDPDGHAMLAVQTPEDAAQALLDLDGDRDRVAELGRRAHAAAQVLTWESAVDQFEAALRQAIS